MAETNFEEVASQFRQALVDCRRLYQTSAQECIASHPTLLPGPPPQFLQLMDDLHKGLLIKIYGTIAEADMRWSGEEAQLAAILFEHVWRQRLSGNRLREATRQVLAESHRLKWYSLIRPFDQIAPLRERLGELETVVLRVANLVAKCDGHVSDSEAAFLRTMEDEILGQLRPLPLDGPPRHAEEDRAAAAAVQQMQREAAQLRQECRLEEARQVPPPAESKSADERLREALQELNDLIGLAGIKHEITTLTNFLQLQQQRAGVGLPTTSLSLHMVFSGNPGTGKTSVARIAGKIFGAMGVLKQGHLVETDRSGLVAQYAGQTGPKTNKKIDEALDGVLFIDEAYSLVAESKEDAYGREAVQTLLKRMEDDRQRLVVILAGYPQPMEELLASNPGLASRFNYKLLFDDYRPAELGRIFQALCDKNHYQAPGGVQARLMLGFDWLYRRRDERFGNGRLVRNTFEQAIRRLANRVAGIVPVTRELLSVLEPEDVDLPGVPANALARCGDERQRFAVVCEGCRGESAVAAALLGRRVKCNACGHRFLAAWAEPVADPAAT